MSELATSGQSDLDVYLQFLFEGLEGYVYIVAKDPVSADWNQGFYSWPTQIDTIKADIKKINFKFEVYIAPALFKEADNAQKDNVKCSNVVWCDFDGNTPTDWKGLDPSLVVRSSMEGHDHVYWRLSEPLYGVQEIENITHRLSYGFGADTSGWDANQVLRPPETFNHKRNKPVSVHSSENCAYTSDSFSIFPEPPTKINIESWTPEVLPDLENVILRTPFGPNLVALIKKERSEVKDRSAALMNFAYSGCEIGMTDIEIFVVLRMLDDKWEKFKHRRDRDRILTQIITRARVKHPNVLDTDSNEPYAIAFNYGSFMAAKFKIDWLVEGMLMDGGSMLMAGPSGIGKSQLTLEAMKHIALGKDWLGYNVKNPKKVGFFSLEMGPAELKVFLQAQDETLDASERLLLQENLIIIPHGEAWPLNLEGGQLQMEALIEQFDLEGVFVDSIGSAIRGSINAQENVQAYVDYVDSMRKRHGIFWWAIHHTRKAGPGQSSQGQDDVYGDQYLVNRATSVYAILPGKDKTIKIDNWKNRLAPKESKYYLRRTPSLTFERLDSGIANGTPLGAPVENPTNDEDEDGINGPFALFD